MKQYDAVMLDIRANYSVDDITRAVKDKAYYAKLFVSEILPAVAKISNQPKYGYHGLTHSTQVALFGLDVAFSLRAAPLPVILAAGLHDCARTHDSDCPHHGPDCVPIAERFLAENYATLLPTDVRRILYAIENHSRNIAAPDAVSACLWDADRIRLAWECGYSPEFFSTWRGKQIAAFSGARRRDYVAYQENFLIRNGIKTRAQIEYEKYMDAQMPMGKTRFKER